MVDRSTIMRLGLKFEGICLCHKIRPYRISSQIDEQELPFKFNFFLESSVPPVDTWKMHHACKSVIRNTNTLGEVKNFLKASKHVLSGFDFDYVMFLEDDAKLKKTFWESIVEILTVLKKEGKLNVRNLPILDCFYVKQPVIQKKLKRGWNNIKPNFKKTGTLALMLPRTYLEKFVKFIESYIYLSPNKYQLDTAMFYHAESIGQEYLLHFPTLTRHLNSRKKG